MKAILERAVTLNEQLTQEDDPRRKTPRFEQQIRTL